MHNIELKKNNFMVCDRPRAKNAMIFEQVKFLNFPLIQLKLYFDVLPRKRSNYSFN